MEEQLNLDELLCLYESIVTQVNDDRKLLLALNGVPPEELEDGTSAKTGEDIRREALERKYKRVADDDFDGEAGYDPILGLDYDIEST